jgi:hypothetical protein
VHGVGFTGVPRSEEPPPPRKRGGVPGGSGCGITRALSLCFPLSRSLSLSPSLSLPLSHSLSLSDGLSSLGTAIVKASNLKELTQPLNLHDDDLVRGLKG